MNYISKQYQVMELNSSFSLNSLYETVDVIGIHAFSLILGNKSLRFEEILNRIGDSVKFGKAHHSFASGSEKRERLRDSLQSLEKNGLIKKKKSVIEDFEIYYITAKGLNEGRKLSKYQYG